MVDVWAELEEQKKLHCHLKSCQFRTTGPELQDTSNVYPPLLRATPTSLVLQEQNTP